jgi:hypothetical protein
MTAPETPDPHDPDAGSFAIVKLPPHQSPPDNTIMHGSINAVMERIIDTNARREALDLLARADDASQSLARTEARADAARARSIRHLGDAITQLNHRLDAIEERRAIQARQDEEAEAARLQAVLDALPSPDEPAAAIYSPGGDLHSLAAPNTAHMGEDDAPSSLEHLERFGSSGTDPVTDPSELAHPKVPKYRNPAAISLNSD